jgi:hypothetical protein
LNLLHRLDFVPFRLNDKAAAAAAAAQHSPALPAAQKPANLRRIETNAKNKI